VSALLQSDAHLTGGIQCRWLDAADYAAAVHRLSGRILGEIWYGAGNPQPVPWPCIAVDLPVLNRSPCVELWLSHQTVLSSHADGWHIAAGSGISLWSYELQPELSLASATARAYQSLAAHLYKTPHQYLLRSWNIIPSIHRHEAGLERYRQFCSGRHDGLLPAMQPQHLPAATAVGSAHGTAKIWCLTASAPGVQVENPRQVSAYRYPDTYGPRSPSFARATLWHPDPNQPQILFLSGTASIVGHRSMHAGDVRAQTIEALRNIDAVQRQAGIARLDAASQLKVYVRTASDYPAVRQTIEGILGTHIPILYLQAEICREELLVEIEGLLQPPGEEH
jgi:chorismate lyase / 3-hydroxybenzoate synthase